MLFVILASNIQRYIERIWWSKRSWNFFIMSRSCKNNFRKFKKTTFELSENNEISNYNDNANLYLQLLQSRKIVLDIIKTEI